MSHCLHCGCEIEKPKGKPRSSQQHRRYMKMIEIAYQNWPESHDFQPFSSEHLRKWCQMAVGHREVAAQIDVSDLPQRQLVAVVTAALKAAGSFAHPVVRGGVLYVVRAKSVAFDKLPHAEATRLYQDVEDYIASETGIRMTEHMEAA